MDTFKKVFLFCTFVGLLFVIFQVWWEKKTGANVDDIRVSKRIANRTWPIILIPVFFSPVPWIWRFLIGLFSFLIMQSYFIFMTRTRLLGTGKDDKKGRGGHV